MFWSCVVICSEKKEKWKMKMCKRKKKRRKKNSEERKDQRGQEERTSWEWASTVEAEGRRQREQRETHLPSRFRFLRGVIPFSFNFSVLLCHFFLLQDFSLPFEEKCTIKLPLDTQSSFPKDLLRQHCHLYFRLDRISMNRF